MRAEPVHARVTRGIARVEVMKPEKNIDVAQAEGRKRVMTGVSEVRGGEGGRGGRVRGRKGRTYACQETREKDRRGGSSCWAGVGEVEQQRRGREAEVEVTEAESGSDRRRRRSGSHRGRVATEVG